jgi:hypothetical protein
MIDYAYYKGSCFAMTQNWVLLMKVPGPAGIAEMSEMSKVLGVGWSGWNSGNGCTVPPLYSAHLTPCVTSGDKSPAGCVTRDWALQVPGGKRRTYLGRGKAAEKEAYNAKVNYNSLDTNINYCDIFTGGGALGPV